MSENLVLVFIKNITSNNIVLYSLLGLCPLILYQLNIKEYLFLGITIATIMLTSTWLALLIYNFVIYPFNLNYLKILSVIVIIYLVIHLVKTIINKFNPSYSRLFDAYPEFFYTNFAIYGSVFLNIKPQISFLNISVNALGLGMGYLTILLIYGSIKERLNNNRSLSLPDQVFAELIILGLLSLVCIGIIGFR